MAHAPGSEDGYFLLFLAPPETSARSAISRDLTLVVDISGSMAGAKMEQARAALVQALGTLSSDDRFRIIAFSSEVREFRDGWAPASREALSQAREWVEAASYGDSLLYLDREELAALRDALQALAEPYLERIADPALRPPRARPVAFVQIAFPVDEL